MSTCKRGHLMDEANTYVAPKTGIPNCRECARGRRGFFKERPCRHCDVLFYRPGGAVYCETCSPDAAAYRRLVAYDLSNDEFDAMYFEQDGECAICHVNEATHVDHNHTTGAVRELLCHSCNAAIGLFLEEPQRLISAALYLMEHDG